MSSLEHNGYMHRHGTATNPTHLPVQVTVEYKLDNGACIPIRVHTIVISVQHSDTVSLEEIRQALKEVIIKVWWPPGAL
jgi:S-adenosylmethionine synthetase